MDWNRMPTDELEQRLIANRRLRSRLDAVDMEILEVLDSRQVATADGCRSLSEWLAGRTDVALDTARSLVRTMRRTLERRDLRLALAEGEATLDRVEAVSRIPGEVGLLPHLDISATRRAAADHARITADCETRGVSDQFLVVQPSLDQSWWKLWGGLDGYSGAIVDKALQEAADALPDEAPADQSWRRAVALTELCMGAEPPAGQVSVFVDAGMAAGSGAETGVVIEAGPRVGRLTLEAILCDASTEIIAVTGQGTPMRYGRRVRTIPPSLRRQIIDRDGNRCSADACDSRYRLQVHHIEPWHLGGLTDPENLTTLCWFHHHVVVHLKGHTAYRHPEHGRVRFTRVGRSPPEPTVQYAGAGTLNP